MQQQLSLLAEATSRVTVEPTAAVLLLGARAADVPRHQALVQLPGVDADTLARMLALAEDALRYNQAPRATLDVDDRHGAGSNGPMGTGSLMADSRGIRDYRSNEQATWPQLLRALRGLSVVTEQERTLSPCLPPGRSAGGRDRAAEPGSRRPPGIERSWRRFGRFSMQPKQASSAPDQRRLLFVRRGREPGARRCPHRRRAAALRRGSGVRRRAPRRRPGAGLRSRPRHETVTVS